MNNFLIKLLFSLYGITLISCVSVNTHQSGRSLGKNNIQFFGNLNYGVTNTDTKNKTNKNEVFLTEIGVYKGITDKTDLGIRLGNSFKITGLLKSQIIGSKKSFYASSIASDIGVGGVSELLIAKESNYNANIYLINSIHPTEKIAFTFTPKYIHSGVIQVEKFNNKTDNMFGYSAGVIVGKNTKFSFEIAQFDNGFNFFSSKPYIGFGILFKKKQTNKSKNTYEN